MKPVTFETQGTESGGIALGDTILDLAAAFAWFERESGSAVRRGARARALGPAFSVSSNTRKTRALPPTRSFAASRPAARPPRSTVGR